MYRETAFANFNWIYDIVHNIRDNFFLIELCERKSFLRTDLENNFFSNTYLSVIIVITLHILTEIKNHMKKSF